MLFAKLIGHYFALFYLATFCSVIGHELSHYFAARLLRLPGIFLCIGFYGFFGIRGKRFFFSPFCLSGYVEYDAQERQLNSLPELLLFYFSGIAFNVLLCILSALQGWFILLSVNAIIIVASMLPFHFASSDLSCFMQEYKTRKEAQR